MLIILAFKHAEVVLLVVTLVIESGSLDLLTFIIWLHTFQVVKGVVVSSYQELLWNAVVVILCHLLLLLLLVEHILVYCHLKRRLNVLAGRLMGFPVILALTRRWLVVAATKSLLILSQHLILILRTKLLSID